MESVESAQEKLDAIILNRLFLDCVSLLKLHNYKKTTSIKGSCTLQNQDNFDVTKIEIIGNKILFDKRYIIDSLTELSEVIVNYQSLEYKKHPKLFNKMRNFDSKIKGNKELYDEWTDLIKELNESLLQAKYQSKRNC